MPGDDRSNLWIRVLVAVVVVFVAFTLVAASLIIGVDPKNEQVSAGERNSRTTTTEPGPEPVEGAGPAPTGDPETDAMLDDIARFVETTRGLAFQQPVTVEVLGDQEFEARLFATLESDLDDLRIEAQVLQALAFVDDVAAVEQGMRALLAAGVLGFYDPETDELVVRGNDFGPLTRQTIAHELVHALDDQWFDLAKPEYDESDDEVGFGVTALAEGNARRIDSRYAARMSKEDRTRLAEEEADIPAPNFSIIPPILLELIAAPYDLGETLVDEILERGDQQALDDRFRAPPRTSEQVIDPEKLFAGEQAAAVAAPPADGTVTDQGTFGELMMRLLLERSMRGGRANRAAGGWGGDRYVVWQQGGDYCVRIDLAMDTPNDVDELEDALRDLVEDLPAARVELPQPDRVRLTSCN